MKKTIILATSLLGIVLEGAPFCHWDFEKCDEQKKYTVSTNGKHRLYSFNAIVPGFKGNGLELNGKKRISVHFPQAAGWNSFTFEVKFKLDQGVDTKVGNALICYAKHSWNRSQFLLKITAKSQLEARFTQDARKNELFLTSKELKFESGKFYTVRVASQDEGALKIWLDGELVAVRDKDSWGMNRLVRKSPSGYPLLTFGNDLSNPSKVFRALNGVMDDIKIWNSFKEPELIADVPSSENGALLVSENKAAGTGKFSVLDRPGAALGSFIRPEQKFIDAAASADVKLTPENLIVQVKSPIARGTNLYTKPGASWEGDYVEFFFRPDPDSGEYFQYMANVSGFKFAAKYNSPGSSDGNFKSRSTIRSCTFPDRWEAEFIIPRSEVGLAGNIDGKIATANFTRTGKTGGGQSTWAPVGSSFHTPSQFRLIVFGSFKTALLKKLAASRQKFNAINGKADLRKSIAAELDTIAKRINADGNRAEAFVPLSTAIDRMILRYTQLKFSGTPNLIWRSNQEWGNDIQVSSLSRPLEKITLTLPQNSFTYTGFVFSNLTPKPFLGQIKCFSMIRKEKKTIYNNFNYNHWGDRSPHYNNIKFFEALPLVSGGVFHDPLLPLHLNTLIQTAGNGSKQIWMRVSSKGMKPGKYNFLMVLKPSYTGFTPIEIPVELNVSKVDLKGIQLDSFHYTWITNRAPSDNLMRLFAEKELNVVYSGGAFGQVSMNVYPQTDEQGNILAYGDYYQFERLIEAMIRFGISKDRIKLICVLELPDFGMRIPGKKRLLQFGSAEWKKGFKNFLYHFTGTMEKKYGITKDRIFFYTIDEPDGDINNPSSRMHKAYLSGKYIKEAGKDFKTMVNPHPYSLRRKDFSALKKLAEVYDVFEFYRPGLGKEQLETAKTLKQEIWTYGIYQKTTPPEIYRREYWQSLRDGFSSMISYWHLESHAGNDGFNSEDGLGSRTDYGSMFADLDMGTYITSRREEAHALGLEDYKLAAYCRNLLKKYPDAALQKELDSIILKGAEADMKGMEQCRLQMLELAEKLTSKANKK